MECDICSECKEHASFYEDTDEESYTTMLVSECCGAPPYNVDQDYDMER